jgi:hypothetical protein
MKPRIYGYAIANDNTKEKNSEKQTENYTNEASKRSDFLNLPSRSVHGYDVFLGLPEACDSLKKKKEALNVRGSKTLTERRRIGNGRKTPKLSISTRPPPSLIYISFSFCSKLSFHAITKMSLESIRSTHYIESCYFHKRFY